MLKILARHLLRRLVKPTAQTVVEDVDDLGTAHNRTAAGRSAKFKSDC